MSKPWEESEFGEREREPGLVPGYPVRWTRKWVTPYQMDGDKARRLIESKILGVFSLVPSENEPVTAMLDFEHLDGFLHVTPTSNLAKGNAWPRNPAASVCIFNWENDQESVNLRGKIEIIRSRELLRRFVRGLLANRRQVNPDDGPWGRVRDAVPHLRSPDWAVLRLHVVKAVSYDGANLRQSERERLDLWGVAKI